jgi:hypothetical protein
MLRILRNGQSASCGCYRQELFVKWRRERAADAIYHHPLYKLHKGMIRRCHDPGHPGYKNYGARGISVCPRWHDFRLFAQDIERDIGPRHTGLTLDRIDNDKGYEPGNVRWATWSQQQRNRRCDRCEALKIEVTSLRAQLAILLWAGEIANFTEPLISAPANSCSPRSSLARHVFAVTTRCGTRPTRLIWTMPTMAGI